MIVLTSVSNAILRLVCLLLGGIAWKGFMVNTAKGNFINYPNVVSMPSAIPIFVDDTPRNQTVNHGSQIVFQCRVYSTVQIIIKWFRKLPDQRQTTGKMLQRLKAPIHYDGASYELLNADAAKALGNNTYLSKLIINHAHWLDEGIYICAGINLHGHRIREAHLHVTAEDKPEQINLNTRKYWLLFLMPFGLASLPASIWLPYMLYKRRRSKAYTNDFQE